MTQVDLGAIRMNIDLSLRKPTVAEVEAYLLNTGWVYERTATAEDGIHQEKIYMKPNSGMLDFEGAYVPVEDYPDPFYMGMVLFKIAAKEKLTEYEVWQRITGEYQISLEKLYDVMHDIERMRNILNKAATDSRSEKSQIVDVTNQGVMLGLDSAKKLVQGFVDREMEKHQ